MARFGLCLRAGRQGFAAARKHVLSEILMGLNMLRTTRLPVSLRSSLPNRRPWALAAALTVVLGACGGGKSDSPAAPGPAQLNVSVTGLLPGKSVALKNGTETLTFTDNATKAFPTAVTLNSALAVSITTQPDVGQTCALPSPNPTVNAAPFTVNVVCTRNAYTLSGIVYGLVSGQTLQLVNTAGTTVQTTAPDSSGKFSFNTLWGDTYSVTVLAQPSRQLCSVKNGAGSVASSLSNLEVRCIGQVWNLYTIAGSPDKAYSADTATGVSASFYAPQGLAFDSKNDSVLVADTNSGAIRKLTDNSVSGAPSATTSTLVGKSFINGFYNAVNIPVTDPTGAANSRFNGPVGVAVDTWSKASTNTKLVYVADTLNHLIRVVTLVNDVVTKVETLAGNGIPGYKEDSTGSNAQFNRPTGIAVDSKGNIYVADTGNHVIRKISPTGTVTLFAGTANVSGAANMASASDKATFNAPMGVAIDSLDNVYVADTLNSVIRKISVSSGAVVKTQTLAGTAGKEGYQDGNGSAASFNRPTGLTVDSSFYLYVADTQNNTIRLLDQTGEVITIAGSATQAAGALDAYPTCAAKTCTVSSGTFNRPGGIAVNKLGDLFVADTGNNTIRYLTKTNPN